MSSPSNQRRPPNELALFGVPAEKFRPAGRTSWRGPCPRCGGTRRFSVFTNHPFPAWNGFCSDCGFNAWLNQVAPQVGRAKPEDWRAAQAEQQQQRTLEAQVRERKLQRYGERATAFHYNRNLNYHRRRQWELVGIPPDWQNHWQLGWTQRTIGGLRLEAMTIPIVDYRGVLVNCQYRYVDPPPGMARYHGEKDLPAAVFIACPEGRLPVAWVVEGAKKAMVLYIHAADAGVQVYGIPGQLTWGRLPEYLPQHERVYLLPDPGAVSAMRRLYEHGAVVELPGKPDDWLLADLAPRADWLRKEAA